MPNDAYPMIILGGDFGGGGPDHGPTQSRPKGWRKYRDPWREGIWAGTRNVEQ